MTSEAAHSPLELFAASVAFVLPIAYTAGIEAETWSARAAILLLVVAVGLPLLLAQCRGPRPLAARSALAFVVVGCASAALSGNHTTAVFGLYNQGTGLLFMTSLAAAWAIGRALRPVARSLIERAVIAGALVNVGIAIVSSVIDLPPSMAVNMFDQGRASALAGNPVHLAALAVLGLALIVPRFQSAPVPWAGAVAAIAVAVQLSGTRLALVVMIGIVVWAARREGVRTGVALGLLLVVGLEVGNLIGPSAISATGRTTGPQPSGSLAVRPQTWLSARHAFVERPLLGIGPGQFRTATSRYRSPSVARAEGPEKLFTDAHNLVVEYATTTGLLGVAALVLWLVAATVPGKSWLLVGALGVLAIHLFEPQSVVTTPLAFLALGASAATGPARPVSTRGAARWIVPAGCVAVSLCLAVVFLAAERDLRRSQLDLSLRPVEQANGILPGWPRAASLLARVWLFQGIVANHDAADYQRSRYWRTVALHRDDTDPGLWNDLAEFDASNGQRQDAAAEFGSALRLNPTSARAMIGLADLARSQCDRGQEGYWRRRAIQVSPPRAAAAPGPDLQGPPCGG